MNYSMKWHKTPLERARVRECSWGVLLTLLRGRLDSPAKAKKLLTDGKWSQTRNSSLPYSSRQPARKFFRSNSVEHQRRFLYQQLFCQRVISTWIHRTHRDSKFSAWSRISGLECRTWHFKFTPWSFLTFEDGRCCAKMQFQCSHCIYQRKIDALTSSSSSKWINYCRSIPTHWHFTLLYATSQITEPPTLCACTLTRSSCSTLSNRSTWVDLCV